MSHETQPERPTPMPTDPQVDPQQAVDALEERIVADTDDEPRVSGEDASGSPAGREPPD